MSTAARVIELAKRSITAGDNDTLRKTLDVLPLDRIDETLRRQLFVELFQLARVAGNKSGLKVIVSVWQQYNVTENLLTFSSYLFMYNTLTMADLQFYASVYEFTAEKLYVDYINGPQDPRVPIALARIDAVFPQLSNLQYRQLHKIAFDKGSDDATIFLQDKVRVTATPTERLNWVSISSLSNGVLQPHRELMKLLPDESVQWDQTNLLDKSVDEVVKALYRASRREGINFTTADESQLGSDLVYSSLRNLYMQATPAERLVIVAPLANGEHRLEYAKPENSPEAARIFRIVGPCNTLLDFNLNLDHICAYYGGCRMLTCTCSSTLDDDDAEISDFSDADAWRNREWFTGYCGQCNRRIDSRANTVRIPLPDGSWHGCYCSVKCMEEIYTNTDLNVFGSDEPLADIEAVKMLWSLVDEQLKTYGIEDRSED